jgi:hypothetical protein
MGKLETLVASKISAGLKPSDALEVAQHQIAWDDYLVEQAGEGGGKFGSGSPIDVVTPAFLNQLYHDIDANAYWRSTGVTSADWVAVEGAPSGITWSPAIADTTGSLDLDLAALIDGEGEIALNGIETIDGTLSATLTQLTGFSAPSLVSGSIDFHGCSILEDLSLPAYLPGDGSTLNFANCALSQASVDHILARCVASEDFVSGTIDLSGGTSSPPSAQGIRDWATLVVRNSGSIQVTINDVDESYSVPVNLTGYSIFDVTGESPTLVGPLVGSTYLFEGDVLLAVSLDDANAVWGNGPTTTSRVYHLFAPYGILHIDYDEYPPLVPEYTGSHNLFRGPPEDLESFILGEEAGGPSAP